MEYTRNYNEDLYQNDKDCLISISDFNEMVRSGEISSYDGFGYYVKNGKKSTEDRAQSPIFNLDATHVVWYNN